MTSPRGKFIKPRALYAHLIVRSISLTPATKDQEPKLFNFAWQQFYRANGYKHSKEFGLNCDPSNRKSDTNYKLTYILHPYRLVPDYASINLGREASSIILARLTALGASFIIYFIIRSHSNDYIRTYYSIIQLLD